MAVTRDDLGGDRLDRKAQFSSYMRLNLRVDIGECPDRTRNRTGCDFGARCNQSFAPTRKLGIGLREF